MSKLIQLRIEVVDPDWKPSILDRCNLLSIPDYIKNEKVNKLFQQKKVLNWQIDGGYIWLEIN